MPKMKTKRGAAKRFKLTGSGKIKRNKAFSSHILTKKSTKRKRDLRKSDLVDSANLKGSQEDSTIPVISGGHWFAREESISVREIRELSLLNLHPDYQAGR